jgi:hypothetical protein
MIKDRSNERGGARLKFIIVMAILISIGYASYLYIPVRYHAYLFKDSMQQFVDIASAQGKPPAWVGEQLTKILDEYEVPANAIITPTTLDNRVQVRVQFTKPIEFPGYTYEYEFDETVKSAAFFVPK